MAVRCYIALGSNLGRRELQLRFAAQYLDRHPEVKVVAASHCYETPALLPEGAPEAWNIAYLNQVLAIDTSLPPLSLLALLKECEAAAGRKKTAHWGPRELDCDLLLYGDEQISLPELTVPHAELAKRDFVLVPLAEIASELMVPGRGETVGALCAKLSSSLALYRRRTKVMGIVNVTPDSFSSRADAREAIRLIERMAGEGADMIDIGGESTRPGAVPLSPDEEWARIVPVLSALPESRRWKVSVDTYHPETAARALAAGADMITMSAVGRRRRCGVMWRSIRSRLFSCIPLPCLPTLPYGFLSKRIRWRW